MSIRKQIRSKRACSGVLDGNVQVITSETARHPRSSDDSAEQLLVEALIHEEWRLQMARAGWFGDDALNTTA